MPTLCANQSWKLNVGKCMQGAGSRPRSLIAFLCHKNVHTIKYGHVSIDTMSKIC